MVNCINDFCLSARQQTSYVILGTGSRRSPTVWRVPVVTRVNYNPARCYCYIHSHLAWSSRPTIGVIRAPAQSARHLLTDGYPKPRSDVVYISLPYPALYCQQSMAPRYV